MTEDEHAIRELVDRWMEASKAGDIPAVLELMTDDVLFMTPHGEPFGKEEFEENSVAMADAKVEGRADVREVEVAGDLAWARTHLEISMTPPGGEPVRRSGYTLTILKKGGDGRWRLFRDANLVG